MYPDLTDIIAALDRLAYFNDMLDLTNCNWDEKRPAGDLHGIVSTAHYIYSLLIKELQEITVRKDDEIFEERQKLKKKEGRTALTASEIVWELDFLEKALNSKENLDYFKANGQGFTHGHVEEDARILCGVLIGFGVGRAYEKTAAGKGEEARDFLVEYKARFKDCMPAGQADAAGAETSAEEADAGKEEGLVMT